MSSEIQNKKLARNHYSDTESAETKKVNLTDLVKGMQNEQKKEKKSNIILSAAAISAVAVFGIILTL